jgi:DNA repair photolyase
MQTIYVPKGSAGEYSPLGCNPYEGCDHGCSYCYQHAMVNRFQPDSDFNNVRPKESFIEALLKDAPKFKGCKQVLLCFACDPYNKLNNTLQTTRQVLEILLANKIAVAILTKGGRNAYQDAILLKMFGPHAMVGTTLTYDNDADSLANEPGAALPGERIEMLKYFHEMGITTWASFEPVMDPNQSLKLLELSTPYCDKFKIGKLNHNPKLEKLIDWGKFLAEAVAIMRKYNKAFIIKSDLLKYNSGTFLNPWEMDFRSLDVEPFKL